MGVSITAINQIPVIVVDCAGKTGNQVHEIISILKEASVLVATRSEKSVYIITNVTNLKFNSEIMAAFKEYAVANTRYVKESVLVGLNGMQTIAFTAIKAITKREYHLSPTMEDAKAYISAL